MSGHRSPLQPVQLAPPEDVILAARSVMGSIDLDVHSCPDVNRLVQAKRFFDCTEDSLEFTLARSWAPESAPAAPKQQGRRVLVAPPATANATRRLINKALREYRLGHIHEALLWIAHNESIIRAPWVWDFPVCLPFRRLRSCWWDDETERFRAISPSDWGAAIYLPPAASSALFETRVARFHVAFAPLGRIVFNQYSGEDDWLSAYRVVTGKSFNFRD